MFSKLDSNKDSYYHILTYSFKSNKYFEEINKLRHTHKLVVSIISTIYLSRKFFYVFINFNIFCVHLYIFLILVLRTVFSIVVL